MKNMKNIGVVGGIIVATLALLFGLAKLGSNANTGEPKDLAKAVTLDEHIRGPVNAPVTLVEYSDFQCPACRSFEPTVKRLQTDFDKELRVVYRNYPLTGLHKNAQVAAYAAEAASIQGKFWEYHDMLFNTQEKWEEESNPESIFVDYAKSLGLNVEQFQRDMKSDVVKAKVSSDAKSGDDSNISATPTFFLNGKYFKIPDTYEGFNAAIVEQLILTGNNTATSTK